MLGAWNTYNGGVAKWYVGNAEVCSAKGMRLPTMFEGNTTATTNANYPTAADGSPTFAGSTDGIPPNGGGTWTATAKADSVNVYWRWTAAGNASGTPSTSAQIRCVLPSVPIVHTVFVTTAIYNGNLGGLTGADTKCQTAATGAGLTGTYKAIISSSTVNAKDRVTINGQVKNRANTVVANSSTDFWDGTLAAAIRTDANAASTADVFTNTTSNGLVLDNTLSCSDWTSASGAVEAALGYAAVTNSGWTDNSNADVCSNSYALYCISQ